MAKLYHISIGLESRRAGFPMASVFYSMMPVRKPKTFKRFDKAIRPSSTFFKVFS
ncbi:hypothetical protein B4135_0133 [Caldibacillus debilis]|uniref:Uncharacterized protein n=1 Tax=Caldibacillus debilis TaxID=301148 RepID=A0A150M531_9BACI|nr:hypothetical protein B4135_0133 [Caldibacillus debilis]